MANAQTEIIHNSSPICHGHLPAVCRPSAGRLQTVHQSPITSRHSGNVEGVRHAGARRSDQVVHQQSAELRHDHLPVSDHGRGRSRRDIIHSRQRQRHGTSRRTGESRPARSVQIQGSGDSDGPWQSEEECSFVSKQRVLNPNINLCHSACSFACIKRPTE